MIPVTPELREAFNPRNGQGGRYIDYAVRFEAVNREAQAEAVPDATQDIQISRLAQVTNRVSDTALDFASFEPRGWPLDGSKVIPPKPDEAPDAEIGLVMPNLSDAEGYYTTPQIITLTTVGNYDLLAVTLDFGFSPAADFDIDLYDGTTLLYHHKVTGNTERRYLMRHAVEGVNKAVVTITRSVIPQRKARLVEFVFGVLLEYDKRSSDSLDVTEVIDPLNERAPAGDLKLVVDNFSRDFNLFDPTSLYAYFQNRQEIIPRIGAQMEDGALGYVGMGKYYLQRPQLKGDLAKLELKAVNLLGVLAESTYNKGVYKTAALTEFVEDIATDAGVDVAYPASWANVVMTAYIPSVSHAEAFRMLAQATGTLLRVSRDDVVTFTEIGEDLLQTLTPSDYKIGGFAPSDDEIVNTVSVEASSVSVSTASEELAKAEGVGTHYLRYDPSTEQVASVVGGSIIDAQFYVDNAVISITGGTITVNGKKILTGRSVVTVTSAQPNERRYVYEVRGQPFIQPANAKAVAERYLALKALSRKTTKVQYRGYPYLETGDVIAFEVGGPITQPFILTKNALKLAGGMTGTLEGRERP